MRSWLSCGVELVKGKVVAKVVDEMWTYLY